MNTRYIFFSIHGHRGMSCSACKGMAVYLFMEMGVSFHSSVEIWTLLLVHKCMWRCLLVLKMKYRYGFCPNMEIWDILVNIWFWAWLLLNVLKHDVSFLYGHYIEIWVSIGPYMEISIYSYHLIRKSGRAIGSYIKLCPFRPIMDLGSSLKSLYKNMMCFVKVSFSPNI